MSLIWSIFKDVLLATWSVPARRLMGIAFRLSIVVGVVAGAFTFVQMHVRYTNFVDDQMRERYRIHYALKYAQRYTDEVLLRYVEKAGGRDIDLRKVGCTENEYWTNLLEIRAQPKDRPHIPDFAALYSHYVDPGSAVASGVLSMAGVIGLVLLLILVRRISVWVIGAERV